MLALNPPRCPCSACRFEIQTFALALDQYREDFGDHPPSLIWFDKSGPWSTEDPGVVSRQARLDGAECLVYFLCGPNGQGFEVGTKTYGPYLEPQADALIDLDDDGFEEMLDAFRTGCVYLYFKADRTKPPGEEYARRDNRHMLDAGGVDARGEPIPPAPGRPHKDGEGNYCNPTTFQVFSAGIDQRYNTDDDIGNFPVR